MTVGSDGGEPGGAPDQAFVRTCCILAGTDAIFPPFVAAARIALEEGAGREAVEALVAAVSLSGAALPPALEPAARQLLTILYTGELHAGEAGAPAEFYEEALAWEVLGFASAPGKCGFGSWSRKAST